MPLLRTCAMVMGCPLALIRYLHSWQITAFNVLLRYTIVSCCWEGHLCFWRKISLIFSRCLTDILEESREPLSASSPLLGCNLDRKPRQAPQGFCLWGEYHHKRPQIPHRALRLRHDTQCSFCHWHPTRARGQPQDSDPPRGQDPFFGREDPISCPKYPRPVPSRSDTIAVGDRVCATWGKPGSRHPCEGHRAVESRVQTTWRRPRGAPSCKDHS